MCGERWKSPVDRIEAGADRQDAELAVGVRLHVGVSLKVRIERNVDAGIAGVRVAADGVRLPELEPSVGLRRAVTSEHAAGDFDDLAARPRPSVAQASEVEVRVEWMFDGMRTVPRSPEGVRAREVVAAFGTGATLLCSA